MARIARLLRERTRSDGANEAYVRVRLLQGLCFNGATMEDEDQLRFSQFLQALSVRNEEAEHRLCGFALQWTRELSQEFWLANAMDEFGESFYRLVDEISQAEEPFASLAEIELVFKEIMQRQLRKDRIWVRRHRLIPSDEIAESFGFESKTEEPTLEQQMMAADLMNALEEFQGQQRDIINDLWFGGLSTYEVAQKLDTTVDTINSQVWRIRVKLKKHPKLKQYFEENDRG